MFTLEVNILWNVMQKQVDSFNLIPFCSYKGHLNKIAWNLTVDKKVRKIILNCLASIAGIYLAIYYLISLIDEHGDDICNRPCSDIQVSRSTAVFFLPRLFCPLNAPPIFTTVVKILSY
jgi:hypothetical protein